MDFNKTLHILCGFPTFHKDLIQLDNLRTLDFFVKQYLMSAFLLFIVHNQLHRLQQENKT